MIGIVGMACRLPGARTVAELWSLLCAGAEGVSQIAEPHLRERGVPDHLIRNDRYVRAAGRLQAIDEFDAGFFGFTPRQAAELDPQHRLFLECAWEALEDAGCDPERFDGAIGVFAGAGPGHHALEQIGADIRNHRLLEVIQRTLGTDKDFLATRVSYKLNLRGPSLTIQTACSTSLVAVHMACQSLLSGECDIALAGGVAIPTSHGCGYLYSEGGILSPDGHCRAFDAGAKGTVPSAGAGVVVLRRMQDAVGARHHFYAAIRNSAVNNDGSAKVGFTAPSVAGQHRVLATALDGTDPATIGLIEAHGTGTVLGDAVELTALGKAFSGGMRQPRSCALGSIKTNIGHLDAAAGVAGLMKAALCLKRRHLVPSLHFGQPNELLNDPQSPFFVNTELRPWTSAGEPRRAGVSSFGMGGTNAHVVLEEAPERIAARKTPGVRIFPLSAKSATALMSVRQQLAGFLAERAEIDLDDVAYTLQSGRRHFEYRAVTTGTTREEIIAGLVAPMEGVQVAPEQPRIQLYVDPIQREDGVEVWRGHDYDGLMSRFAATANGSAASTVGAFEPLAAQASIARALLRHGVRPEVLIASGVGVLVAAYVADAVDSDDFVRLLALLLRSPTIDRASLKAVAFRRPSIRMVSAIQGTEIRLEDFYDARFWAAQLEKTNVASIPVEPGVMLVPTSRAGLSRWCADSTGRPCIAGEPDLVKRSLGALWMSGAVIDWSSLYTTFQPCLTPLPTYPFERSSFRLPEHQSVSSGGQAGLYLPLWKPAPAARPTAVVDSGTWLVVSDGSTLAESTASHLRSLGLEVEVCKEVPSGVSQPVSHILHFVPESAGFGGTNGLDAYVQAQTEGLLTVVRNVSAVGRLNPSAPLTVGVVTRRLSADCLSVNAPYLETLTVLPAALRQEFANVRMKVIDVLPGEGAQREASRIVAELHDPSGSPVVVYRSGRRLQLGFERLSDTSTPEGLPLRQGGVYLITGGLGKIGRELAVSLARRYGARVILLSRRAAAVSTDSDPILREVESVGGRALIVAADVANTESLRAAIEQTKGELGPVNGVFHLAADLEGLAAQGLKKLTAEQLASQAHPKVGGLLALEEVFAGQPLDFAVLFSSISVFLAGVGLGAYAAANAAMDGLARSDRRCGGAQWQTINWDSWEEGAVAQLSGVVGLKPDDRIEALLHAMSLTGIPQVVVSAGGFEERLESLRSFEPLPVAIDSDPMPVALAHVPTVPAALEDLERRVTAIWEENLGRRAIGLDDDFFALGGDSLVMLGVTAAVGDWLHIEVPLRDFFDGGRTVRGFCERLRARLIEEVE